MDVDRIIAGLSRPMRNAVLDLGPFFGIRHPVFNWEGPYRGHSAQTLNALHRRGLTWGRENYSSRWVALLPLGLQVRARLTQETDHG